MVPFIVSANSVVSKYTEDFVYVLSTFFHGLALNSGLLEYMMKYMVMFYSHHIAQNCDCK